MFASHPLTTLVPYLRRYRRQMLWGTLLVLLTNLAAVTAPWVLGRAIDDLSDGVDRDKLIFYAALIVGISLVEGIFRFGMRKVLIGASRLIEYDLRNDLFAHLQRLSASFFQKHPTGDLMARSTNDLSAVRSVLGPGIMYSLNTLFTTVLAVSILLTLDRSLALLTLLPLLMVTACVKYFGKQIHQRFSRIQEQFSDLTTRVQENVSGIRVVKAYAQEEAFVGLFAESNLEYLRRSLSLVRVSGLFNPLLVFLLGLSSVGLLWFGGRQVIAGVLSLGDFVAFMSYLAMLTWPTIALGWVINVVERGSASMARIQRLLDTQPEITNREDSRDFPLSGSLEVRDLSFAYNGQPVLQSISFKVAAGETLAIVGSTGSGKSTLANLLCRLYPVPEGKILFDGVDINEIKLPTLRGSIGYVQQDTFLFSETVHSNIAFGRPSASRQRVEQVAQVSNILPDIVDFPKGFDTFVGERGITLSGGQKQRIAISRALLIDPRILLLDDSLSSVDTYTEEKILQQLSTATADRTTVVVSHRISTVRSAHQILVMDDGRIVERGTHDDLLGQDGVYSQLYQRQLLQEELELE